MNSDEVYLHYLWQKLTFQIIHKNGLWILLTLFLTASCTWYLANLLDKQISHSKEANLARKTAIGYGISFLALWLFSFIM